MSRHAFGAAILICGIVTLVWHATSGPIWIYALAAAQILGGIALQFERTVKCGAIAIAAAYLALCAFHQPICGSCSTALCADDDPLWRHRMDTDTHCGSAPAWELG